MFQIRFWRPVCPISVATGNCPATSVRPLEQDSVVLDIRVLAGGTARKHQCRGPTNAALQIAQKKLKFIPAAQNAQPVEVERQIAIVFQLIHAVTGVLCLCVPAVPSP